MLSEMRPVAELRPAKPSDLALVTGILEGSDLPLDGVSEAFGGFIVAESDGQIVGVAGLESCCDNALLRSVAVKPEWRGRGLARALVTRVIADAESRGLNGLYLLTTTAEQYFPSFGFRVVSREAVPSDVRETSEFRTACPASATVMELRLRSAAAKRS